MSNELEQLKTQRLMLLGLLSEKPDVKEKVMAAHAELTAVAEKHGEEGTVALALLGMEIGIKEWES